MTEESLSGRHGTRSGLWREIDMCVAAPGIVESVGDNIAKINYNGNIVNANAGLIKVTAGDYVLVHAGMIIQKLDKTEADKMTELFKELEELGNA